MTAKNAPSAAPRARSSSVVTVSTSAARSTRISAFPAVIDDKGKPAEYVPVSEWKLPAIDLDKCTGCMLCVEVCPEYALAVSKPRTPGDLYSIAFLAEEEKCMGCGMCAGRCPVSAIEMVKKYA